MGLRINTNVAALNAHKNLSITDAILTKSMGRLSSGYRINGAKDDAAGLAIANTFRAEVRGLRVAQQNASQAIAMLNVAEGGAQRVEEMVERLTELAIQAASDNVGNTDRTKINSEAGKILDEIERIADNTKYKGTVLLDGTLTASFQIGTSNNANCYIDLTFSQGLEKADLGIDSLDLTSKSNAYSAIGTLETALSSVNSFMGDVGALQNRLEFAASNIAVEIENKSASESAIRDVDMAGEMITFTKAQILLQSGTAMLAQANLAPQNILSLLGG